MRKSGFKSKDCNSCEDKYSERCNCWGCDRFENEYFCPYASCIECGAMDKKIISKNLQWAWTEGR